MSNLSITVLVAIIAFATLQHRRVPGGSGVSYSAHDGPSASLDQLAGNGRIYLIQVGAHYLPYSVDEMAVWLRTKYHLDVQVLAPVQLDRSAWVGSRRQYIAEILDDQLKREHPDLAADPNAYLIGFTDEDMFSAWHSWKFSDTQRDMKRVAVISAAHLSAPFFYRVGANGGSSNELLQRRLRRFLLKDVAILYWRLPANEDASSLLQRFLPPDVPAEDIFASDLDPAREKWGRAEGAPCIFLQYSPKEGIKPFAGQLVRGCSDEDFPRTDESEEVFELSLEYGTLLDRHTDFYLPGNPPIQFERVTRPGWTGPMGFGISGTHSYDKYLRSPDDMGTIQVIQPEGNWLTLKRVPRWLPLLSLVKYVDTDFSGNFYEMRWHATPFENFSLTRYDGQVESYLPCDDKVLCYETAFRDREAQELVFERDANRRLTRLTSSGNQWISLIYDSGNKITQISDSRGRKVNYGYDERGRLISVNYPSGETYFYTYDNEQRLLSFSVAATSASSPQIMLRNTYRDGRLVTQALADGSTYTLTYKSWSAEDSASIVIVGASGGPSLKVAIKGFESTVWELPATEAER